MILNIDESWNPIRSLLNQEPLTKLNTDILPNISYQPKQENIFKVFEQPLSSIKIVILGEDPSPIPGEAVGYAFINGNNKKPVSLRNIEQEVLTSDPDRINDSGEINMKAWVDQGVFLLNTALTVETGRAGSHLRYWEEFTKKVVQLISSSQPCIWLLWGAKAQQFRSYINLNSFSVSGYDSETIKEIPSNEDWNYILTAPHPAAEAYTGGKAGFFGCNHFYFTNEILKRLNKKEILW